MLTHILPSTTIYQLENALHELHLSLPISKDLSVITKPKLVANKEIGNAFVALPMEGNDSQPDGSPSELTYRRYRRFASGGSAIIWMEATAVCEDGRSSPHALWLNQQNVDSFKSLIDEIRTAAREQYNRDVVIIMQMTHAGRYSTPDGTPRPKLTHHVPELDEAQGILPSDPLVSDSYLEKMQDRYVDAAYLAQQAGFDGVDIKCCHGYLLSGLLGAHLRDGPYSTAFENRTRFVRSVVDCIGSELPGLIRAVRMNVFDGQPYPYGWGASKDGSRKPDPAEPVRLARELAKMGVGLMSVTLGLPRFDPHFGRPGALTPAQKAAGMEHPLYGIARFISLTGLIQRTLKDVPVVCAGLGWLRQLMPQVAAGMVKEGFCSLIGQGRGMFAYPDSVRDIIAQGFMYPKKCCVTCGKCSLLMKQGRNAGCVIRDPECYML
jgi:2,4-dienoyl-CoA reductase-like NADH-dependent reductase (Old Yellow Enzyme family)